MPSARRILIVGNSGSGKSTLARTLVEAHGLAHLDLDPLAWLPTDPPERAPLDTTAVTLAAFADCADEWVVEGCYADLLALLAPRARQLVFLDLAVDRCQAHARARPWEPHKYASKAEQDENLPMLLRWIANYPSRDGPLGRAAHQALFDGFPGEKRRVAEPGDAMG